MKKQTLRLLGVSLLLAAACSRAPYQQIEVDGRDVAIDQDPEAAGLNPADPTFKSLYNELFGTLTCVNCHQPGGAAHVDGVTTLDFSDPGASYNGLLATTQRPSNPSQCGNVKRVVPGEPDASYLLATLFAEYNRENFAGSSGCKPYAHNVNLSGDEKAALVQWIQQGAPNN